MSAPAAGAPQPEVESTYEVPPGAADGVARALDALACGGIKVDGRELRCDGIRARASTYLYPPTATAQETERLIFRYDPGGIYGRLSTKRWEPHGDGSAKFHRGEVRKPGLAEWAELLRERPRVDSALFKVQRRYTFRFPDGQGARVALDAMVPFPPDDPAGSGAPFFHLEIEAIGECEPAAVAGAIASRHPALAGLAKTACSKRQQAAEGTAPAALSFASGGQLAEYLEQVYREGSMKLRPMASRLLTDGVRLRP